MLHRLCTWEFWIQTKHKFLLERALLLDGCGTHSSIRRGIMIWKGAVYSVWEQLLCFEKETLKRGFKVSLLDAAMSNHQRHQAAGLWTSSKQPGKRGPLRACTANSGSTAMSLARIVIGFGQYAFFINATSLLIACVKILVTHSDTGNCTQLHQKA